MPPPAMKNTAKHGNIDPFLDNGSEDDDDQSLTQSANNVAIHSSESRKFQRALFLLKAREIHKISQQALCDIMTDFNVLVDGILDNLCSELTSKLESNGISADTIGLAEFNDTMLRDPFHGLYSEHLRTKYFCGWNRAWSKISARNY